MSDYVKIHTEESVLKIGFNRPDKKNALNSQMYYAAKDALVSASNDSSIRVVLLYGEGGDFTSGNDVKDFLAFATTKLSEGNDIQFPAKEFLDVLIPFNKPIIAAVDGVAIGIGLFLALLGFADHTDFVVGGAGTIVSLGNMFPDDGSLTDRLLGYDQSMMVFVFGLMFTGALIGRKVPGHPPS